MLSIILLQVHSKEYLAIHSKKIFSPKGCFYAFNIIFNTCNGIYNRIFYSVILKFQQLILLVIECATRISKTGILKFYPLISSCKLIYQIFTIILAIYYYLYYYYMYYYYITMYYYIIY